MRSVGSVFHTLLSLLCAAPRVCVLLSPSLARTAQLHLRSQRRWPTRGAEKHGGNGTEKDWAVLSPHGLQTRVIFRPAFHVGESMGLCDCLLCQNDGLIYGRCNSIHTHAYAYTYTHVTHTYIHTHMHTHIYPVLLLFIIYLHISINSLLLYNLCSIFINPVVLRSLFKFKLLTSPAGSR